MKFEEKDGWMISTPILVGSSDAVCRAQKCEHKEYREGVKKVERGMLLVHEVCKECVAARVKYRPATPEELHEEA